MYQTSKKIIMAACKKSQPKKNFKESKIGIVDVLIALRKKNRDLMYGVSVYPNGQIITFDQFVDDEPMIWNLETDDINLQKPEVVEYIHYLFKKKAKKI